MSDRVPEFDTGQDPLGEDVERQLGRARIEIREDVSQLTKVVQDRISDLETEFRDLTAEPSFNRALVKNQIITSYSGVPLDLGAIDQTLTLIFDVTNVSPVWILPTLATDGSLGFGDERLRSTRWSVLPFPPFNIDPGDHARLSLVFHVSERFAESLTFCAKGESFPVDLSELSVEFRTRDDKQRWANVGFLSIGKEATVVVPDSEAAKKIRTLSRWDKSDGAKP